MNCGAVQCGFCVPGFIVSAYALLEQNPDPTREEVRDWFQKTRNVCRCTGYKQIVDAVMAAAKVSAASRISSSTIRKMATTTENRLFVRMHLVRFVV